MVVTAKDLRFKIADLFNALGKKEDIIITYRGKPKAKLVGIDQKGKKEDVAFGIWSDKEDDVDAVVRAMRKGRRFDI